MDQQKIGQFIADNRKNLGLTQKELAEKIEVSDKTISKWETGNGLPEIALLKPLCDALSINVNELLSGEHLAENVYSLKAEENIMTLMQENQRNKKSNIIHYLLGGLLALLAVIFLFAFSGSGNHMTLSYFLDFANLILQILLCTAAVLLSGKRTKLEILNVLEKVAIPSGVIICMAGFIFFMTSMEDLSTVGPNLALCVLSILYGVITYYIVVILKAHVK